MKEKYIKPSLMKVDLVEELIMASGPTPTPCVDDAPCSGDTPCSSDSCSIAG